MRLNKFNSLVVVFFSYFLALFFAYKTISFFLDYHILIQVLIADIAATVIIYLSSVVFKNSSINDPYSSVIPLFIFIYLFIVMSLSNFNPSITLIFVNVLFWSIRLTNNWIKNWEGMSSEDWRYIDMRNYSGKYFELSNFFGIHLFPTIIVFVCCIPIYFVCTPDYSFSIYAIIGFFISLLGVFYEIVSDYQLYNFRSDNDKKDKIINTGLWKYSRHPNYWGEILFWWGLYIYVIDVAPIYMILAPISMTLMFVYVSIPWIEHKILRTRPQYEEYAKNTDFLIPEISFIKKIINK